MLVAVCGACPGLGKTTLCSALAEWMTDIGLQTDLFGEAEVLARPTFTAMADAFTVQLELEL